MRAIATPIASKSWSWLIAFLAMFLVSGSAASEPPGSLAAIIPERESLPDKIWDPDTRVDANQIDMFVSNYCFFAWDLMTGDPGLTYPRGTNKTAVFSGGLWMGATVGNDLRVSVAEYSSTYTPGRLFSPTQWDDPDDPALRVYKIAWGDTPQTNPDYAEWPSDYGAPVDALGNPRHFGAQTLWSVFNDTAERTPNDAATPDPLGIEVQLTTFALDASGEAQTTVFMEWKVINTGGNFLEDAYIATWSDPDLGGPADDLVGCDPPLSLGYCYNSTNADEDYGASPPSVGFQLVQGPIVPSPGDEAYVSGRTIPDYRNLPMTAFSKYINGTDPDSPQASYNYMQGLNADGTPVIDPVTGEVTTYMVPGDPVAGDGWIDANPADRRMMVTAGPFNMAPGDTQIVAAAILIGQGQDRLASVTEVKRLAEMAPILFRSVMGDAMGACCLASGECVQATATECLDGSFHLLEPCDPDPCLTPTGACCFDDGICLISDEEACAGRYQGDGTTCAPGTCPVFGPAAACCLGNGLCQVQTEYDCLQLGGTYIAGVDCELLPPGGPPGWQRNDMDRPMIDEVAGPGGTPVPPDGHGGPGNAVWHSRNSTSEWIMSAGGGDGGEGRFTRNGADLANLTEKDVILRWDNDPENIGWWLFDQGEAAPIPFGLYERDPITGEETRLVPVLFSGSGTTAGIYDLANDYPDPFSGWPATDWCYAYRFDPEIATWEEFVQDAQDGDIDVDPITVELFARMILASDIWSLPADGTVIQLSTKKSGIVAGSGFDGAVPLDWPEAEGAIACIDSPQYDVHRDGVLIGTTTRTDFLDDSGLPAGETYAYSIRTRNPYTGETSEASIPVAAVPQAGGYGADCGLASAIPLIDGIVDLQEWAGATVIDATPSIGSPPCILRLMNDGGLLYIALEDGVSASDFRVYVDANGNGVFDLDSLEGMVSFENGVRRFVRLEGAYPDVQVVEEVVNPNWMLAAAGAMQAEMRLTLYAGPLVDRPDSDVVPLFFHSAGGGAVYPQGPPVVLAQAPPLFAAIQLADAPPMPPLAISAIPVPLCVPGQDLVLSVVLTSDATVAGVVCRYRPLAQAPAGHGEPEAGGAPIDLSMTADGAGRYAAVLPAGEVPAGGLAYRIRVTEFSGRVLESDEIVVEPLASSGLPESSPAIATALVYPNPFRATTAITFRVPKEERVSAAIYNVRGEVVRRLTDGAPFRAGVHSLGWDGTDARGHAAMSGIYFVRIQGESFRFERTLTMLR